MAGILMEARGQPGEQEEEERPMPELCLFWEQHDLPKTN